MQCFATGLSESIWEISVLFLIFKNYFWNCSLSFAKFGTFSVFIFSNMHSIPLIFSSSGILIMSTGPFVIIGQSLELSSFIFSYLLTILGVVKFYWSVLKFIDPVICTVPLSLCCDIYVTVFFSYIIYIWFFLNNFQIFADIPIFYLFHED